MLVAALYLALAVLVDNIVTALPCIRLLPCISLDLEGGDWRLREKDLKVNLDVEEMPTSWYNIVSDLPEPLPPPLDPNTLKPASPDSLLRIFAKECILQETSTEKSIKIPDEVADAYIRNGRPTPIHRAKRLEDYLKTPAKIYFKREDLSPTGSHKPNTAIAQAFYAKKEGVERLTTETGAGQWGSALALGSAYFDMKCTVYMTRASYVQKPYRRVMMQLYGAEVLSSPSSNTSVGRSFHSQNNEHPGSLGIAISEALEDCLNHDTTKYCLGSVLNHVLLHQSIIGLEARKEFEKLDLKPDIIVGCIGGGSNFAGLAYPFVRDKLNKKSDPKFIGVEPKAVPSTTKGVYAYDYADTGKLTPLLKMYTVGHTYQCPPIHAGGLRYHGKAPSLSLLIKSGVVSTKAYTQNEIMEAGRLFSTIEGIVPAPETCHAVKAVIDEALTCKRTGEDKVILFNFSGHGLLDLKAYEDYFGGRLIDSEDQRNIEKSIASIPRVDSQ
jgi:tryptophan synthase beta chain